MLNSCVRRGRRHRRSTAHGVRRMSADGHARSRSSGRCSVACRLLVVLALRARVVSTVFGMMMAVAADLPDLENREEFQHARNSVLVRPQRPARSAC